MGAGLSMPDGMLVLQFVAGFVVVVSADLFFEPSGLPSW
jgi:hypothetical protein